MTNLELFDDEQTANYLTLENAAVVLGVSVATVSNWLKLGVLTQAEQIKKKVVSKESVDELRLKIDLGESEKLQKRANKKRSTKKRVHNELNDSEVNRFLTFIDSFSDSYSIDELLISIATTLAENEKKQCGGGEWFKRIGIEIDGWREETNSKENICIELKKYSLPQALDLLGKTYQHLSASSSKAIGGVFYTPKHIAEGYVKTLQKKNDSVLDPCCGSGSFLLEALLKKLKDKEEKPLNNIYGSDLDGRAVRICRINLLLTANKKYDGALNIHHKDGIEFLNTLNVESIPNTFDFIATNPPWGADFNLPKVNNAYLKRFGSDSFSVFLATAIDRLSNKGRLSFLLPQSFVDVGTHSPIRKKLLAETSHIKISQLGKVFKGLLTDVVNIKLQNSAPTIDAELLLETNNGEFTVLQSKVLSETDSTFIFGVSANAAALIEKIFSHSHTLIDSKSQFALGIVTGNNAKLLKDEMLEGYEEVIRGKEISPFKIAKAEKFVKFDRSTFQQCADESYFRAKEKLIYRFIADKFMFAYDDKQLLTLNSANILIPNTTVPIKVVLAILQSKVIQFVFRVKFNSIKILRKHIEAMPIFQFSKEINKRIEKLVDEAIACEEIDLGSIVAKIDSIIYNQLCLTDAEIKTIDDYLNKKLK